jgi:hypothetical protein
MAVSARSSLTAGVAAVSAIIVVLSCTPVLQVRAEHPVPASANPARAFAVRLLAELQQMQNASDTTGTQLKPMAATKTAATPAAATPAAATPAATTTATPLAAVSSFGLPGVQNAIINGYNTVMPWVDWGVETAQWAVGWVPWVGWVGADQIGIFYFNLIRPIITSAVYNTAYVIGGSVGFFPAIGNFINDTGNAINGFIRAEINWALSFLPPLPPLPFAATKAAAAKQADASATAAAATPSATNKTPDTRASKDAKAKKQPRPATDTGTPRSTPNKSATDTQPADNTATADKDTGKSTKRRADIHSSGKSGAGTKTDTGTKTDKGAGKSGKSGKHSGKAPAKSGSTNSGSRGSNSGQHGSK